MTKSGTIVAVYDNERLAETAVDNLAELLGGRAAITLAGIDRRSCGLPINLYKADHRVRVWGQPARIWEKEWPIFADGVSIPGPLGAMLVLGYMTSAVIAAVDGHDSVTGVQAFGAALLKVGISPSDIVAYEAQLSDGRFIVMATAGDEHTVLSAATAGAIRTQHYDALSAAPAMPPAREDHHIEMHCQG